MDRLAVIKERFLCGKDIDSRDIGWLIDEIEHLRMVIYYTHIAHVNYQKEMNHGMV